MADAQFVVYNDAGIEQVSFGGINLALVHKEVINNMASWTATSGPLQTGVSYSFTVNAVNPIVAVASDKSGAQGAVFATATNTGTNQWRIDLWGGATVTSTSSQAGANTLNANVNVYVFDVAPAPVGSSGFGLVLFDATGKCTFNSNYPAARVVQLLGVNQATGVFDTLTPPAGRTYATVLRSTCGQQIIGSRNPSSGDRLANTFGYGVAGGMSGAQMTCGPYGPATSSNGSLSCFVAGLTVSIAGSAGGPGGIGQIYTTFGCQYVLGGVTRFFSDGLVLDVTNF